jgi:hypothetical protein
MISEIILQYYAKSFSLWAIGFYISSLQRQALKYYLPDTGDQRPFRYICIVAL